MRRRMLVKLRAAAALTKHQPQAQLSEGFRTGMESRIGDRLPTVCSHNRWMERLRRLQVRNMTRLRSRIGLVAVGALLAALLQANPAHAAQNEYGAIAYSPSTEIAAAGFAGNKDDAALAAVDQCRAQGGAADCAAYLWFYQAYGALARGSSDHFGTGWGTDSHYSDTYAIQTCKQQGGGNSCHVTFRASTPSVADETPPATGGAFATPVHGAPSTPPYTTPYTPPPYTTPYTPPPSSISMPNLVGLSRDDAQRALPPGLWLGTVSGNDGTVVDQQPRAGDQVLPYTRVNLVLSGPGFPVWLAVLLAILAVLVVGLTLLAARVLQRRAECRRWDGRIRVKPAPDPNPTIHLREPNRAASFAVRVEVHPDHGVHSVREVVPND